jgi:uncharacterized membrane protein (UPF0127 family)
MRIVNKTKNNQLAHKAKNCSSLLARLRGLMFSKTFNGYDAYYLAPCNSIHTFFMAFSIDVIMLDKESKVVQIFENLRPWRLTRIYFKVQATIELPIGSIKSLLVEKGDSLEIIND